VEQLDARNVQITVLESEANACKTITARQISPSTPGPTALHTAADRSKSQPFLSPASTQPPGIPVRQSRAPLHGSHQSGRAGSTAGCRVEPPQSTRRYKIQCQSAPRPFITKPESCLSVPAPVSSAPPFHGRRRRSQGRAGHRDPDNLKPGLPGDVAALLPAVPPHHCAGRRPDQGARGVGYQNRLVFLKIVENR
jgi:hypothetical protein